MTPRRLRTLTSRQRSAKTLRGQARTADAWPDNTGSQKISRAASQHPVLRSPPYRLQQLQRLQQLAVTSTIALKD